MKKFFAVIGNPPYQDEKSDNKRKPPIYHLFMDEVNKVGEKILLITPARFLSNSGQTPEKWNLEKLNDEHFSVLSYEPDGSKIFPNTDIKGGVVITIQNKEKTYGTIKVFSPYEEMNDILKKVSVNDGMDALISVRGLYRLSEEAYKKCPGIQEILGEGNGNMLAASIFKKLPKLFLEKPVNDKDKYLRIIGRVDGTKERQERFVKEKFLNENKFTKSYKVFIAKAIGSGEFGEPLSDLMLGKPFEGSTDTFLNIGPFKSAEEAKNCQKYLHTRFSRALLGVLKVTHNMTAGTWKYVPLQDFTSKSDIDWTKSVHEIDLQLYEKYGLSKEEKDFIETHVKEMV